MPGCHSCAKIALLLSSIEAAAVQQDVTAYACAGDAACMLHAACLARQTKLGPLISSSLPLKLDSTFLPYQAATGSTQASAGVTLWRKK